MDFAYTAEDEAFRTELTEWLDENLEKFLADWPTGEDAEEAAGPRSGRDHGRDGAPPSLAAQAQRRTLGAPSDGLRSGAVARRRSTQNVIYSETMAKYRTPGIYNANGLWQIGPMIIRWGTDEQKQRWVPNILNADDHWCQGFSEPEAGSDLANLRTLAVQDGDDYVLNGRKIWTSSAHIAKWGLFLVRTDPKAIEEGRKHEGITALIIDLDAPGIDIRPIRDLAGEEMFCEIFFDDARVPVDNRLGGEGEGWLVAMGTLGNERVGTAGLAIGMRADLDSMINLAKAVNPDALRDPELRERIARAHTDIEYTKLLNYRALVEDPAQREELARGSAREAAVEPPRPDPRRARRRSARPPRDDGEGRTRCRRRRRVESAVHVPALHLDRRRHHRGPEEHHRRQGDQAPP